MSDEQKMIRCARNNSLYGIPCVAALSLALVYFHEANIPEAERVICAGIGSIFGWCIALWGAALLLRYNFGGKP